MYCVKLCHFDFLSNNLTEYFGIWKWECNEGKENLSP